MSGNQQGVIESDSLELDLESPIGEEDLVPLSRQPKRLDGFCSTLESEGCNKCELGKESRVVVSRGNINSPLMFVGQNPGAQELKLGQPFVGPAGKLLNEMISEAGLDKWQPYFTNSGLCGTPGNRPLNEEEQAACLPYLQTQIRYLVPSVIICVGMPPVIAMFPGFKNSRASSLVNKAQVYVEPSSGMRFTCIYIYHPAFLLRKKGASDYDRYYNLVMKTLRNVDPMIRKEEERRKEAPIF